ncbi:flagellar hook-associated protein FlgK [Salipaludibacillus sp. HK11]|uniref:flagellar hook-associated protein FlgK n=1 Tax=Salipaludibacillus sp. HK11 TaxID=3394320 RepID=UPI0039FCE33A
MLSTFHGLETSRRALSTHQAALHTTGHNIANANTPGYSRQRVNFTQTEAFPNPGFNQPGIPGQLGTGVKAGEIQRVREAFLDMQFRAEHNKSAYWDARRTSLEKIEDIMNEPTEDGLANTMDRFWQSLQDLAANPEDSGTRSVVRERGIAIAETFNYSYNSLEAIQRDHKEQIGVQEKQINSLLTQIDNLNKQIASVEPHGMLPNDLYDQRDMLVDELSQFVNIKVERVASGGAAKEMADGKYTISLMDDRGRDTGIKLIDGATLRKNTIEVNFSDDNEAVNSITFTNGALVDPDNEIYNTVMTGDGAQVSINEFFNSSGALSSVIEAYGYDTGSFNATGEFESGDIEGLYPDMMANLDVMASTFADEFNRIHSSGWSLSEIESGEKVGFDFFDYSGEDSTAQNLRISDEIKSSRNNIAASGSADNIFVRMSGDGDEVDGPMVSGIFEGDGYDEISVRYDNVSEQWEYSTDGGTTYIEFDDTTTTSIDGLTINVLGVTEDDTVWSLADLENGERPPGDAYAGDGSNALALANVKDTNLNFGEDSTTNIQSFYQGVIGQMAVDTNEAGRLARNTATLRDSVHQNRQSISSVSLDEEMSNMIQFQHAYNAAARNLTAVDEMLDVIINRMGLVGR